MGSYHFFHKLFSDAFPQVLIAIITSRLYNIMINNSIFKRIIFMNEFMDRMSVIIPSYQPDEKLPEVIKGLSEKGFRDIVLVDDGGGETYAPFFEKAAAFPGVTVLTHPENKGKGCALKTAFQYCIKERPACSGVITVDGDNQHHIEDILACCGKLSEKPDHVILGARNFSAKEVPFRSRFGNVLTKGVFRFACGIKITDTQTGLRAIPACYLKTMTEIEGNRYEYETNMLLELKARRIPFEEVPIRTIYLDENDSSHFNPLKDSIRIYRTIFAFAASSFASSLIDLGLFYLCISLLTHMMPEGIWNIVVATAVARVCSSLFNYNMNRQKVFCSGSKNSIVKYYILCVVQFAASAGIVSLLSYLFPAGSLGKTLMKALTDIVLFLLSYQIQREWVFRKE